MNALCEAMSKMISFHSLWLVSAPGLVLVVLMLACSMEKALGGNHSDRHAWDDDLRSLELLDGKAFQRLVYPLVIMSANAYLYPNVISIEGWTLVDAVAPIHGGMHALVYQDVLNSGRMVLAFRGTELSDSESSRADLCADDILWEHNDVLPTVDCSEFSSDTINYYKQAVDYTKKVLDVNPGASLLMTGHSLGAGLAVLMAATFGTNPLLPIIAFSAPGAKRAMEKLSLNLTIHHDKKLFIVADKWDEVMRKSWTYQVGTLCLWETAKTENCRECFSEEFTSFYVPTDPCTLNVSGSSSLGTYDLHQSIAQPQSTPHDDKLQETLVGMISGNASCQVCFLETHYLQHVIDLVELGNKPLCIGFYPLCMI